MAQIAVTSWFNSKYRLIVPILLVESARIRHYLQQYRPVVEW
jgi:hypothetical protein